MFEDFAERRLSTARSDLFLRIGGEGPPLLLLHGYPQTHVIWHRVAPQLARFFTIVMPDLPGYGASKGPPPDAEHRNYSKRAVAVEMVELMRELGFPRFCLAGHDRGGRVGYRLCLDHPDRVVRFAALDIIPTLDMWEEMDWRKALGTYHWQFLAVPPPVPERLIGAEPELFVRHLLQRWAGKGEPLHPQAVAAYIKQFRNPHVLAATCEDYRAGASIDRDHDLEDRAAHRRIECPVLVLWGRGYQASAAPSPAAAWRRWAPTVEEIALDCGHFLAEEAPEDCVKALLKFFQGSAEAGLPPGQAG